MVESGLDVVGMSHPNLFFVFLVVRFVFGVVVTTQPAIDGVVFDGLWVGLVACNHFDVVVIGVLGLSVVENIPHLVVLDLFVVIGYFITHPGVVDSVLFLDGEPNHALADLPTFFLSSPAVLVDDSIWAMHQAPNITETTKNRCQFINFYFLFFVPSLFLQNDLYIRFGS